MQCWKPRPTDVCLVETWLDGDIDDCELSIVGKYVIVHLDRKRHNGGVAIIFHNHLRRMFCLRAQMNIFFNCVNSKPRCFFTDHPNLLYNPHLFDSLCDTILTLDHSHLVLLGDFNVDFSTQSSHPMYPHLCNLTETFSLRQIVDGATHISTSLKG